MITLIPRQLKLFNPLFGGAVEFVNVGDPDEALKLTFKQPDGSTSVKQFLVGTECFLESPTSILQVPDDQLLASCSMAAILAGEVHPGTREFLTQVASDQNSSNFQTIIGNAKLKTVTVVETGDIATEGTIYNVEFQKIGSSTGKTVQTDIVAICKYANRADNYVLSVHCAPGSVHTALGLKKSELGAVDSTNRLAVIDFLENQRFYA